MKSVLLTCNVSHKALPYILPHHGIFKSMLDTSKLRVIFNGSIKLKTRLSINDCLHAGPKLQADIFDVLFRWRQYRIVFSADIVKMFRQIEISPEDQHLQRILWRASNTEPIGFYNLTTVTSGLVNSSYQAIRTFLQLALDENERFPRASRILRESRYVDDILAGADHLNEAIGIKNEFFKMLMAGGFPLSKWASNDSHLLSQLLLEHRALPQHRMWQHSETYQMLGVSRRPNDDSFFFSSERQFPTGIVTKRKALSLTAQLFDRLGWLSPITISFKIFMQSLWHTGMVWDGYLSTPLQKKWQSLLGDLQNLYLISVPRWIGLSANSDIVELHGFSDASDRAYAACLYLRVIDTQN